MDPKIDDKDVSQIGTEGTETPPVEPTPNFNPRNAMMDQIAKRVESLRDKDEAETRYPTEDEDGNLTPPDDEELSLEDAAAKADAAAEALPPPEDSIAEPEGSGGPEGSQPPKAAPIDPGAEYDVEVDGRLVKVLGSKIIEEGRKAVQKNGAADLRLNLASELLEEAKRRVGQLPEGADSQPPRDTSVQQESPTSSDEEDLKLAEVIQYGTKEQAAEAIRALRSTQKAVTPDQVAGFVMRQLGPMMEQQLQFREAVDFVQKDYKDILDNPYTRRLFFLEENRRRAPRDRGGEGDNRSYKELYKSIGDDIRKNLNIPAPKADPTETMADRQTAKSTGPRAVPVNAGGRIPATPAPKEPTREEILEDMRRRRHQPTQATG